MSGTVLWYGDVTCNSEASERAVYHWATCIGTDEMAWDLGDAVFGAWV